MNTLNIKNDTRVLMEEFVKFLEEISSVIYHKILTYQTEDIHQYVNQQEYRVLYLTEINDQVSVTLDENDDRILNSQSSATAVIKRQAELDTAADIKSQIIIISLPTSSVTDKSKFSIDNLKTLVKYGVGSYFSLLEHYHQLDEYSKHAIGHTKFKVRNMLTDIEALQQTIQVPDLLSDIPVPIQNWLQKHEGHEDSQIIEESAELINDAHFLNLVLSLVHNWVKKIQDVVQLDHNLLDGALRDEIAFWNAKENALISVRDQLASPQVTLILEVLKTSKRSHAAVTLTSSLSVKEPLRVSTINNEFLKNLDMNNLLSADTMVNLQLAINDIFDNFKKIKILRYPIEKAVILLKLITEDFESKLIDLVSTDNLFLINKTQFDSVHEQIVTQLDMFENNMRIVINMLRGLLRKQDNIFVPIKIDSPTFIKEKLNEIKSIRGDHSTFTNSILSLVDGNDFLPDDHVPVYHQLYSESQIAYDSLSSLPTRRVFEKENMLFTSHKKTYYQQISFIERKLVNLIKRLLATVSEDSTTLFNIFRKFQVLLSKPQIRLMLHQFHSILLQATEKELDDLEKQFLSQSEIKDILSLRKIPTFSSKMIWIKQVLNSIARIFSHLELILTKQWSNYPEGKRFSTRISVLLSDINIDGLLSNWTEETNKRTKNSFFKSQVLVEFTNKNGTVRYQLNIDHADLEIYQEIVCLKLLGLKIPTVILSYGKKVHLVRKYASLIEELLRQFYDISTKLEKLGDLYHLISPLVDEIKSQINYLSTETWLDVLKAEELVTTGEPGKLHLQKLVHDLQANVMQVAESFHDLADVERKYDLLLHNIDQCDYERHILTKHISSLQDLVQNIHAKKFLDVAKFVEIANMKVEKILAKKCQAELKIICKFWTAENEQLFTTERTHKIVVQNFSISINPPLQSSKQYFLESLNSLLLIVKQQWSLYSPIYDEKVRTENFYNFETFDVQLLYTKCYKIILSRFEEIEKFCLEWKSLQFLWDDESIELKLSEDQNLELWKQTLVKFGKMRDVFDSLETSKAFGLLRIDFEQAQSRIFSKFDSYQRKLLDSYGIVFKELMGKEAQEVQNLKNTLEDQVFDLSNPSSIILVLSSLVSAQELLSSKQTTLDNLKEGQAILIKYRYQFPADWIFVNQMNDDLEIVKLLNYRNSHYLDSHAEIIGAVLKEATQKFMKDLSIAKSKWQRQKPDQNFSVQNAVQVLQEFETLFNDLEDSHQKLLKACLLIGLPLERDAKVELSEVNHLQHVWSCIMKLYHTLDSARSAEWFSCNLVKLKITLEDSLSLSRTLAVNIRSYPAFLTAQGKLKETLKEIPLISLLHNEALELSHWNEIFTSITLKKSPEILSLGDVLDLNLSKNEKYLKSVINKAESEKLLETTIVGIEQLWKSYKFERYEMSTQLVLITGWTNLFTSIEDSLNMLESIKASPYYTKFAHRVINFEKRLTSLFQIISIWHEAQKQWVYLLGIFEDKDKLGRLMPLDSSRFENVSYEFNRLISEALSVSVALDITDITDMQRNIQRLSESLSKIRDSLVGYLEKQRELFPRFHFIGNDDLLELIGNSTNIAIISKHINKLFTGVFSLEYDQNLMLIKSVRSSEGEQLTLKTPISLATNEVLVDWLKVLESTIRFSLSDLLFELFEKLKRSTADATFSTLEEILEAYPNQLVILGYQIFWTENIENAMTSDELTTAYDNLKQLSSQLVKMITKSVSPLLRIKAENLLIESLHKESIISFLIEDHAFSLDHFLWFSEQKFYLTKDTSNYIAGVKVKHGNYVTDYGFEYLGTFNKLVYTPLLTSTFTLLSEALNQNLGGLLLGPAGTGKTESIKALGYSLGRSVFVFCCDETFDVESVSRILVGVTQIGGWGCFDEFNRLEEKMLSGISTTIEKIQNAFSVKDASVELLSNFYTIHKNSGVFITNNPNYEGRSILPDNLTSKFLSFSLMVPDSEIITRVLLATQGFIDAHLLANYLVVFFNNMERLSSTQKHYDFGLRSLKSVIIHAGKMRRNQPQGDVSDPELQLIQRSCYDVILPRLLPFDEKTFFEEIAKFDVPYIVPKDSSKFKETLLQTAKARGFAASDEWLIKCMQIYEIQKLNHGFMLVGPSCSGKTVSFTCFAEAFSKLTEVRNECYRIDANVLSKAAIFGELDYATREWKDGIVTSILRKANSREETAKNIWIVFDGSINPVWVENLNSVLDDNRLLTLPNGERIVMPANVRLVFETDNLNHVTPATISRCGMIAFNKPCFRMVDVLKHSLLEFRKKNLRDEEYYNKSLVSHGLTVDDFKESIINHTFDIVDDDTLQKVWKLSESFSHIMNANRYKAIFSIPEFMKQTIIRLLKFLETHSYAARNNFSTYFEREIFLCFFWSFGSELDHNDRLNFIAELSKLDGFKHIMPISTAEKLSRTRISLPDGKLEGFDSLLQQIDIEPHRILGPGIVIPTVDTCIYENLIFTILDQHKPLILCGPPGSGKTMLLLASIRKLMGFDLVGLNFSKETTVNSVVKALEQCCEYKKTISGITLSPRIPGKWIVLFCDELNLPKSDNYGTQEVIQFLRQIVTNRGFWHPRDRVWVTTSNIQFVGACNPISTFGRIPMTERFTNFCTTIMVDYPSLDSLKRIYGIYSSSILKTVPELAGYAQPFADSLIDVYQKYQTYFNCTSQPHYLCSPRELTRWVKGVYTALKPMNACDLENLIRLWAHESLRLFSDRLSAEKEKDWFFDTILDVARTNFPYKDISKALSRPILFSDWLNYEYQSIDKPSFEKFLEGRFNLYNEEESNVSIVLYEDLLDHILRVDRVLKNTQGHMILVGPSGSGKTTLAKFVTWMNGINAVQLNVSKNFGLSDFDKILKELLVKASVGNEKICFIIDESTILEDSFLEKMNTLLANAEVPGLFEGDEFEELINSCSSASKAEGVVLDSVEEVYQWFVQRVAENFHVIFTMSDTQSSNANPFISSSALFNRCVVNWMGDWSGKSLEAVTTELTKAIPLDSSDYKLENKDGKVIGLRAIVTKLLVAIHTDVRSMQNDISPSHFLNFLKTFFAIFSYEENSLQELSSHVTKGLSHLKEAYLNVKKLGVILSKKEEDLKVEDSKARKLLDKMITDQNESERKQDMSVKMQQLFAEQEKEIVKRRKIVVKDLKEVQELIEEAQKGVLDIKKQHLTELRSMHNPPETIKLVLESICIMLGYSVQNWRDVQHVIRQDDFIASIINFKGDEQLTPEIFSFMKNHYLSKNNFNYEAANRASKACGPLFMWIRAQLQFSAIVVKFAPLKNELKILEDKLVDTKAKMIAINSLIKDLQDEVERYKGKYSETIRMKENIKIEMETVKQKLDRSVRLLSSLSGERQRWEASLLQYQKQKDSMVGNTILNSAFITYCGSLTPNTRAKLLQHWKSSLLESHIAVNIMEEQYLLSGILPPENIIKWQKFGLPNDEQFIGNTAILASTFNTRFPFIIDPTGLLIPFLTRLVEPKQLVISSFLDPDFNKKLENCVKFGGSILICDGEYFDPVISRLIARDVRVVGAGRTVVKLGDKDVDMSSDFQLYIHTKDSTINILPFVSSRMNVLNYSLTFETMINEALNLTLEVKEPKIEAERLLLLQKNSECKEQLKKYERELLELLSSSEDNILDDDNLLSKLEILKHETEVLGKQMLESDKMIHDYNTIRDEFGPLGNVYAKMKKVFEEFTSVNKNYTFPEDNLKKLLREALVSNPSSSVEELGLKFFRLIYEETSTSILEKDKGILLKVLKSLSDVTNFEEKSLSDTILQNQFIILRSSKGNDATIKIKELLSTENFESVKYAMGSNDSYDVANRMITELKDSKTWLIIENIELSNEFLETINETISNLKSRERAEKVQFKLILTSKIDSELPSLLLRSCKQIYIENEQGLKRIMVDHLLSETSTLSLHNLNNVKPREFKKISFVLVWFFSLISSRLRFKKGGFTERYEFSQSDLRNAEKFISKFISTRYESNQNDFEVTPGMFETIAQMISSLIFGGKFTESSDLRTLQRCGFALFNSGLLNPQFNLLEFGGVEKLFAPDGYSTLDYVEWIENLPAKEPMDWLGLPEDAEAIQREIQERSNDEAVERIMRMV